MLPDDEIVVAIPLLDAGRGGSDGRRLCSQNRSLDRSGETGHPCAAWGVRIFERPDPECKPSNSRFRTLKRVDSNIKGSGFQDDRQRAARRAVIGHHERPGINRSMATGRAITAGGLANPNDPPGGA